MHKRKLHSLLVRLRAVPRWCFLGAGVFFLIIGVLAYRQNNVRMLELREAVFQADEQDGDVEGALRALREHVYAHMNTDLAAGENAIRPPIQLKYTYERLVATTQTQGQSGNTDLYTEAQRHCEQQQPGAFYGRDRLPCIRDYLDAHGVQTTEEVDIPSELYKFDFVSPRWSFDLAGWSFIFAGISLMLFAVRFATERAIIHRLNI